MRHVEYAMNRIQQALERVHEDRFTPVMLSPRIPDYLIELAAMQPSGVSEFSRFIFSLPDDALESELLRSVLPECIRQEVLDLRTRHQQLQTSKEAMIDRQDFDKARDVRDQQEQLAISIRELTATQELLVTPTLIASVLRTLGYGG